MFDAVCFRDGATPQGGIDLGLMARPSFFTEKPRNFSAAFDVLELPRHPRV